MSAVVSVDCKEVRTALAGLKPLWGGKSGGAWKRGVVLIVTERRARLFSTDLDVFASVHLRSAQCDGTDNVRCALDTAGIRTLLGVLPKKGIARLDLVATLPLPEGSPEVATSAFNLQACGAKIVGMLGGDAIVEVSTRPMPTGETATVGVFNGIAVEAIQTVRCVCSADPTRYVLNGILFEADGSVVATDGHRLHKLASTITHDTAPIVPALLWDVAAGLMGDGFHMQTVVRPSTGESPDGIHKATPSYFVTCNGPRVDVWGRGIDGRFPDYRQVVPQDGSNPSKVDVDAATLAAVLRKHLAIHVNDRCPTVRVHVNGGLALDSQSPDTGTLQDIVEGHREGPDSAVFGVNAAYLLKSVECVGKGTLAVGDPLCPMTINNRNLQCVIMPVRI